MTHEETKAQRGKVSCPGHTAEWQGQNLNPDFLPPEPMIVTTSLYCLHLYEEGLGLGQGDLGRGFEGVSFFNRLHFLEQL